jgi:acetylornithine deacetylase
LQNLVGIPSVNPMGRPLSGPGYHEAAMSDFLERFFRELGVPFRREQIRPGRDNVIAHYEAPASRRTVLYDVHQDTVPTDGMTIDPFGAVIEDGRLHGRGACDVKGGMAAMLSAFSRLVTERPKGSASVILACTVDEEYTHVGSSRLAEQRLPVDLAVVAEPTRMDLVTTHKGAVRWKIVARGTACHSSTPDLGENAIYKMARVVSALRAHAEELSRGKSDPMLGAATLSVGRIEGGQSVNVVPDWCEIEVDRRLIPGELAIDAPRRAAEFVRDAIGSLDGLEFLPAWVKMPSLSPNMPSSDLDAMSDATSSVTGRTPRRVGVPYGTDAGPLGESGIPCVVFGPGDIAQAHTKDEWIDLDELRQATEVYYRMALALG